MKRILSFVCAIVLLGTLAIHVYATDSAKMTISSGSGTCYRGQTMDFSVKISPVEDCRSAAFMLVYDTNVFEFISGSCTLSGTALASFSSGTGTFAFGSGTDVSGSIFTFTLKVKDNAPVGQYGITANVNTRDSSGNIPTTVNTLSVTVACDHQFGSLKYEPNGEFHFWECALCGYRKNEAHKWGDLVVRTPATCKDTGVGFRKCSVCYVEKEEILKKTGIHSFGPWSTIDGSTHKRSCTVCSEEETAAHTWDTGTVTKQPDCMNTGIVTYKCTCCGTQKTETIDKTSTHTYGKWVKVDDNTHKHSCSVCAKEETASHIWDAGTVTKQPDCMNTGVMTYKCTDCSAAKTETLPKTTVHTYDHNCDTQCNICGAERSITHNYSGTYQSDNNHHWLRCKVCGSKKDVQQHIPGDEATEQSPQTCTVCGYILAPALSHTHNYAADWTSDELSHWHTCDGCSQYDALENHAFDNDCDADCAVCGYTREISHTFEGDWEYDGARHWRSCTVCGTRETEEAHIPGDAPTADAAQTCQSCGYELAPALGTEPVPETTAPALDNNPADPQGYPWWILLLILAVTAIVTILFLNRKKQ